jgi:hypothetical protein
MVDIIGGIRGLPECPKCRSELTAIRQLLRVECNIISFFSNLGYREEKKYVKSRSKTCWIVELDCGGLFIYEHKDGVIVSSMVTCHE